MSQINQNPHPRIFRPTFSPHLLRWRSVYGLHLALAPFLRVELMDPRDVELVAAALQQGDVPRLGTVQAKRIETGWRPKRSPWSPGGSHMK